MSKALYMDDCYLKEFEAAIETGIKTVIVPKSNLKDIIIHPSKLKKIQIIPVESIIDVLKQAIDWKGKQQILNKITRARKR